MYTGKAAHLMPVLTTGYNAPEGFQNGATCIVQAATSQHRCGYHTSALRLYSPTYSGTEEYGRLGSYSENLIIRYAAIINNEFSDQSAWMILKYKYDNESEKQAFIQHVSSAAAGSGTRQHSIVAEDMFITRETPTWSTLDIRLGIGQVYLDSVTRGRVSSVNLTITTANFGYAGLGGVTEVTGTPAGTTPNNLNPSIPKLYL